MYYESELYHYGRLGQKWGVRHGPPYPLSENAKVLAREGNKIVDDVDEIGTNRGKRKARKQAFTMTDEELKASINRMNIEQQYSDLIAKSDTKKGAQYAHTAFNVAIDIATISSAIATTTWIIKQIAKG